MFSAKIEEVIKASLTDGMITEKERQVIKRLAAAEGIDEDTVDVLLDARIQELNREKKAEQRICPHCGAVLESFSTRCPACGEEVRQTRTVSSIKELDARLKNVTDLNQRRSIITSFPVPNTREDLLEFLALSAANAKRMGNFTDTALWRFLLIIIPLWIVFILFSMHTINDPESKFYGQALSDQIGLDAFVALLLGGFFALRYAKKGGNKEIKVHNEMRSVWKAKFEQVMSKARITLHSSQDIAQLDELERQVKGR
jgi:hypothetical protein